MGSFSIWHWVIVLIAIAPVFPIFTILKKAGFSGWWALLYLLPGVSFIALFVFAYSRWPTAKAA